MEPAAPNYHPPQDICPPLLGLEPNFPVGRPCRLPGSWARWLLAGRLSPFCRGGSILCYRRGRGRSWHLGFALLAGLAEELLLVQANPREEAKGLPRWASGLEPRTPAFCCCHPAWCWLLERAGRVCCHVNSALVSRGLSKINLGISLPLALVEYRLFSLRFWELCLLPEYCLWPPSGLLLCLSPCRLPA